MSKRGVPGIYIRRLDVTISDITRHRRLLNYIKMYYRRFFRQLDFSPKSHAILQTVSSLSFVPCFFLCYSCCRISELNQISVSLIKSRSPIQIKSSKSSHTRSINGFLDFKNKTLLSVPDNSEILVISYDQLKLSIKSARSICNIYLPDRALDCTHVFRHLQASYWSSQNIDINTISYRLGHLNNKTTYTYIHDNI